MIKDRSPTFVNTWPLLCNTLVCRVELLADAEVLFNDTLVVPNTYLA